MFIKYKKFKFTDSMINQKSNLLRIKKIKSSLLTTTGSILLFATLQGCVAYGPQPYYYSSTPVSYYSYPSLGYYWPWVSLSSGGYGWKPGYSGRGHGFNSYYRYNESGSVYSQGFWDRRGDYGNRH
jgi:hypothetical protein